MTLSRFRLLRLALALMTLALLPVTPGAEAATRVEIVRSPGGVEAWLVRQTTLPIVAFDFVMRGGSAQDPAGREGLAGIVAAMMDEGAGELSSEAFAERLQDRAIELSFSSGRDTFGGSLRFLSEHRQEAFALLALALSAPRFDAAPLDRVKQSALAGLRRASTNPNAIANEAFWRLAFPGHPYGRRPSGSAESVAAITRDDLVGFHGRVVARAHLKVAVVGDITAAELAPILDQVFGALPANATLTPVPDVAMAGAGGRHVIALDAPQTILTLGAPGLKRDDPDFIPAFVMNHILGGGGMNSRLFEEVREKRGLAYSVSTGLTALEATGLITAGTSTRNERAGESLDVILGELARMGRDGPTEEELERSKRFLIGSWALRFDTSNAIAGNLLRIQQDGYGPDYLDRRNALIEAVTLADVRRAARRLLAEAQPLAILVGKPAGL